MGKIYKILEMHYWYFCIRLNVYSNNSNNVDSASAQFTAVLPATTKSEKFTSLKTKVIKK